MSRTTQMRLSAVKTWQNQMFIQLIDTQKLREKLLIGIWWPRKNLLIRTDPPGELLQ